MYRAEEKRIIYAIIRDSKKKKTTVMEWARNCKKSCIMRTRRGTSALRESEYDIKESGKTVKGGVIGEFTIQENKRV